jgi:hypothetical protein
MMSRRLGIALLLLVVGEVHAQDMPESLLPATTQIYVRWDGVEAHRAAFDRTALGKILQGDTGTFLTGVFTQLQETIAPLVTAQQLLGGAPPARLLTLQADVKEAPKLFELLGKQGFILAAELRSLEPFRGRVTLLLPNAGERPAPLFGLLRLATSLAGVESKETSIAGRTVQHLQAGPVHVAWWVEGKHALVVAGTEPAEAVVKQMDLRDARLTAHSLFRKVHGFQQFETAARAFVDVAALVKVVQTRGPDVSKIIEDLGLDGLTSWISYSGFDGDAERGLVELDMTGPRRGLLRMLSSKPFTLADVPPVPPDATSWSMTVFDSGVLYDTALQVTETIVRLVSPEDLPKVRELLKQADDALGISLRKDLLGSLGDQVVLYNSPGDGPFTLGQSFLFKVKDANKLHLALEQLIKGLAKVTETNITLRKRTYHGVEVREVHVRQEGFIFVPSYTVHKDWLVVSSFPQPVHGYILRSTGALPAWKPDARVQAALGKLPQEFLSVSVSDPRPTVRQLLSLAPLVGGAVRSFVPEAKFDVGALPNTHEVARHLFPNVSVVSDDGRTVRLETRSSVVLPLELSGLDTYAVFSLFAFAARF